MEYISKLIDLFLHLDVHLHELILQYGTLTYSILFAVIFAETGFVFTPFLPGDSLLFAAGTFAAKGSFNVHLLFFILSVAAVLGDTVNYWIGHYIGMKIFNWKIPFLKKEHIDKTHQFYEKYGGKTIIIARFVPIVRTFAPFVAGVGKMHYGNFIKYNLMGGLVLKKGSNGAEYYGFSKRFPILGGDGLCVSSGSGAVNSVSFSSSLG